MIYLISLVIFVLDYFSKEIVVSNLPLARGVPVCPGFNLFFVLNNGISFSFLQAHSYFGVIGLVLLALVICIFLVYFIHHEKDNYSRLALAMVLGGAFGNIIDRIRYGAVIDFIDLYFGSYHWPSFNIADSFICIGMGLLFIKMCKKEKK